MSHAEFVAEMAAVSDLLSAINLLNWDARTQMPPGGAETRAKQIATLTAMARDRAASDAMQQLISRAEDTLADVPETDLRRRALAQAKREIDILRRIPAALITETAELSAKSHSLWAKARAEDDFALFAPVIEKTFALQRGIAEAIGYDDHPYDALVSRYEPGMTRAKLRPLFDALRSGIAPLLDRARGAEVRTDFLTRGFPVAAQKAFGIALAERMGYDMTRGRVDDTVHPFEISFTRQDVRITSRFRADALAAGFFALWHEAGHGMYEQNIAPEFTRSIFATDLVNLYAVGGTSFGAHESQSRLWENRVGRSHRFWEQHYPELVAAFPDQLADVSLEEFWRAANRAEPGLIRVEADELTYDMHIILRAEIEMALLTGDLAVADLSAAWAEKMRDYLGVAVPSDRLGVLQDVHWSHGYVGSFPTYTIGNVMAAQFFETALQAPGVAAGLDRGDYAPLRGWLTENVYRHGRSRLPDDLLVQATGRSLETGPYLAALSAKVDMLA
ncbi:MAG: carboxypeptidase M32 [Paracoccaceae bacterium]|nr:carboxypeptidase M32 [Paracoccaceae bacterium]